MPVIPRAGPHGGGKKNPVTIPPARKSPHTHSPATPFRATRPVTASGVSAANVVATIDVPAKPPPPPAPPRKKKNPGRAGRGQRARGGGRPARGGGGRGKHPTPRSPSSPYWPPL